MTTKYMRSYGTFKKILYSDFLIFTAINQAPSAAERKMKTFFHAVGHVIFLLCVSR